jgi:hypothetical protein
MNSSNPDTAVVRNDDKAFMQVASAIDNNDPLTGTCAPASLSPIRKRPFPQSSEKESHRYPDTKKHASNQENTQEGQSFLEGCMLHPTSPIKLFATYQDETVRKSLADTPNILIRDHWSYQHCWTLREMMGLDRFSGICQEGQDANAVASDGLGIDFVLVQTS